MHVLPVDCRRRLIHTIMHREFTDCEMSLPHLHLTLYSIHSFKYILINIPLGYHKIFEYILVYETVILDVDLQVTFGR